MNKAGELDFKTMAILAITVVIMIILFFIYKRIFS